MVERYENIKELTGAEIPEADVWVAGFPCQDVSLARMGKRDGLRGAQSGLFYKFAELVGKRRPELFVIENVSGLLSSHKGRDFGTVLGTLAELGYHLGWRVLDSQHFGVPQSRKRVYLVGSYSDRGAPAKILFESECSEGMPSTRGPNGKKSISPLQVGIVHPGSRRPITKSIAYCLYAESARHTGTDWSRNYVSYPDEGEVRRLTPDECEGVMAFPAGWTDIRVSLAEPDRETARYHALGNAVTPPVASWIAARLKQYLLETRQDDCCEQASAATA
jgi:DNA (cytosine-5)-methyltransferase 1